MPPRPGKYNQGNLPSGPRSFTITGERVEQIEPLISLMREVGAKHGGKTPAQASLPTLRLARAACLHLETNQPCGS